jgi:superfamily II DNA or RNA helicase
VQCSVPLPGAVLWIRQCRWRVRRARRDREIVCLDVSGESGDMTFLAPIDRPVAAAVRDRFRYRRPQHVIARLAALLARSASSRAINAAIDARIEILPYQLEPAFALLGSTRRVLIADAVGLGKTIQAGLTIAELARRTPNLRALVVVPASLRHQWTDELRAHFHLDVFHADAAGLNDLARSAMRGDVPWDRPGVWLASLDYLKQPHVLPGLTSDIWDLLVLDEAHSACGASDRHAAADALAKRARRVLLLSATPHQGDDTKFNRLLDLGALPLDRDDVVVFRRTRDQLGIRVDRRIRWHLIRPSAAEQHVLRGLVDFEAFVLRSAGDAHHHAAVLLLSVFRKRALSTMGAFVTSIDRRLAWLSARVNSLESTPWRQPRLEFDEHEDAFAPEEQEWLMADVGISADRERSWLRRLSDLGRIASRDDSKLRHLCSLLRRAREPVAVFTEFRDSLHVLLNRIQLIRPTAVLHGLLSADAQRDQLNRFLAGDASILLATDVASQGLNLQARCRWVLNLELPWNPARLEQRAGRVDRIGQRRRVHVGLLVSRHEAEGGMLARLARRTLTAERSLGSDALCVTASEAAVRAHLLAGVPIVEAEPSPRIVRPCDAWKRPARVAANRLRHRRALSSVWRAALDGTRPAWTRLDGSPALRRLLGGGDLLCFSVPLIDGAGALVESSCVVVRVPAANGPPDAAVIASARDMASRVVQPRARRLRHLRGAAHDRRVALERAIAGILTCELTPAELQPGLFDRRALRAGESAAQSIAAIQRDLHDRLARLDDERLIDVGIPILELAVGS